MTIAKDMELSIERSSWIRKMFEEGARLAAEYGAENIFDFTLGNPNVEPPDAFFDVLKECADTKGKNYHGYMPNTGYPHVREVIARVLSKEQEVEVSPAEIIMTCGAAGALNVTLKAILDPGDTVLTPAPFFAEYTFYAKNHGGALVPVPTNEDFTLDIAAMENAIDSRTKAVLINSPNNPTGQVYTEEGVKALGKLLEKKSKELGRTIYLLADEPYRKIVYEGVHVPSIFHWYKESVVATSYSKELSVPGERIGWLAVHPEATYKGPLLNAMALANRILGFVNAPALMQRVVAKLESESVDISHYARKRELICKGLQEAGYQFTWPGGAFYLFCKTPIEDDVAFVAALQKERILTVPGRGFGGPGHMRIAFCVADETIKKALPGFAKVMKEFS